MTIKIDVLFRILRPFVRPYTDKRRIREMEELAEKLLPSFKLDSNSTTIDLGANRGDFTVLAAKKGGIVYAFEPNPFAFNYLAKRTTSMKRVIAFPLAVSDSTGFTEYFDHPDAPTDPLGYSIRGSLLKKEPGFQASARPVLTVDFSNILSGIDEVTCLKVDIEGSERYIWPTIKTNYKKIKFLLMEIHDSLDPAIRGEIELFIEANKLEDCWTTRWK